MLEPEKSTPVLFDREWRKSRRSGNNANCVEVSSRKSGSLLVRDSKDPGGLVISLSEHSWLEFIGRIRIGDFDLERIGRHPDGDGVTAYRIDEGIAFTGSEVGDKKLVFTLDEWSAFTAGVCDGEFDLPLPAQPLRV
jgi:hypothetical protein